jgi:hypothetical protein
VRQRTGRRQPPDVQKAAVQLTQEVPDATACELFQELAIDGAEVPTRPEMATGRRPGRKDVMVKTPASASRSHPPSGVSETLRALVSGRTLDAPTSRLIGSPHPPGRGQWGNGEAEGLGGLA